MRRDSEIADADSAVRVEAEDFVKGKDDRRSSRDDRAADDAHLALVNIAATDGEPAIDDRRNAEDEAEHHDYGKAVADAGLEVGGVEAAARLGERGQRVEEKHRGDHERRAKPRATLRREFFVELHSVDVCCFFDGQRLFPLNHAHTTTTSACGEDVAHTQNARAGRGSGKEMNTRPDSTKLAKLQELDSLLPREIRGQSHALPRIISVVRRGELSLTKPARPRGSFLLLGPTGV